MYHGAMPEDGDDDDDMLHLSYVRCRHYPDHQEETSPLTLNPTLLWASHTRLAPNRTLLRDETTLAKAQHDAQLEHTYTSGGYSKGEWSRLYSHAMSVLPLFDAGSIPSNLVVDGITGRCFLVRALVHPDDGVAAAAARALQQVMYLHAGLRVPVFKALLGLLGRIPPSDVAVQATLLGQFCHLSEVRACTAALRERQGQAATPCIHAATPRIQAATPCIQTATLRIHDATPCIQVWIAQLEQQDPFNLGNAAMLEPVEPYLCRMESEALIALHHPLASVRLPALQP